MRTDTKHVRLAGLDTLRMLAIVLVLMSHYNGFVSQAPTFGVPGNIGWAGVDLFFVLSGYLIGNQLLAPAARGESLDLGTFFARRLLRTLPNYYAVLAVYLLLPDSPIAGKSMAPAWRFLTFTQNFGLNYGETFTHSWSLCIEEQFYLVLPLAVLALVGSRRSPRLLWCALFAAIGAGMTARGAAFMDGKDVFAAPVYYSSLCRFDELLPGVAIAMLKNFHPGAFARVLRYGNTLLAAGLAMAAAVLYGVMNEAPSAFAASAFGFSLVACSFALLTCSALSPGSLLNRLRIPGAASLALWSYAVYLVHKPVFMALRPALERHAIDPGAPSTIAAVMAAGILGGWLLYRLVETPFMQLRERWYPGVASTTGHTAASSATGNAIGRRA
ncbi:acyltransferase family protein [Pseudoduganella umbonata]|uniref:Acyltransferase n=1 Tax=Pseudoduganella umbonata TaxID=864828 RepID=A0A4P8HWY1_9BURK|nr:acyltransferase [Pseudoduganella umbonata]MBB3223060.1 peptidoglycan/LPS O-acetylase OafA/YrhL [Pseudoduganella umbonata]QCP13160.1 acyltransferase [Pseudoduganella umbonata]